MTTQEIRSRVIRYASFVLAASCAWWALSRGLPRYRELAALRAHRARVEATTLKAREMTVRSGGREMEDSISAARARVAAVRELVPQVGSGESDGDVRRMIVGFAEHAHVAVRQLEDGPAAREGSLVVSTARVTANGRYHDLGSWLSMVGSTHRLVQVDGIVMGVVPDSVTGAGGAGVPSGTEQPGSVVLEARFRWFRQDSASVTQDSAARRQ